MLKSIINNLNLYWAYRENITSAYLCVEWKEHRKEIEEKRKWIRWKIYEAIKNPFVSFRGKIDIVLVSILPLRIYALLRRLLKE